MNKIFTKLFIVLAMLFTFGAQSNALVVNDIKADNSRAPQIKAMLEAGLMTVDANGNFNPTGTIARQDFLSVFLNTCRLQVSDAELMNMFKDVFPYMKTYDEITLAENYGIVFGYPDNTFKPTSPITKSEAISLISNIFIKNYNDDSVLNAYSDADKIPAWARYSYVKAAHNGFLPAGGELDPNGYLTREEVASFMTDVFVHINSNFKTFSFGRDKQKIKAMFLQDEILEVSPKALDNAVSQYNVKMVVQPYNLAPVHFENDFNSYKAAIGDKVEFISEEDLVTNQGTLVYPAGTKIIGTVIQKEKSKWLDREHKCTLDIAKIITVDNLNINFEAAPYSENRKLYIVKGDKEVAKDRLEAATRAKYLLNFKDFVRPSLKYNVKKGDKIYLLLTGGLVVRTVDPELVDNSNL